MLDGIQILEHGETVLDDCPPQDCVAFVDFKGDEWQLAGLGCAVDKRTSRTYMQYLVLLGPEELTTPPYQYDILPVPVFTDWFEPAGVCGCDEGFGCSPCIRRSLCDDRRERKWRVKVQAE